MRIENEIRKRITRQLTAVYQVIQGDPSHPSAEEIFQRARQVLPHISRGTVYRNLQRLVDEGKIRVFYSDERIARYDPTLKEHDHFICQQCRGVEDVWLERDRRVNLAPLIEQGFTVLTHKLAIYGLCQHCATTTQQRKRLNKRRLHNHAPRMSRTELRSKGGKKWHEVRNARDRDIDTKQ